MPHASDLSSTTSLQNVFVFGSFEPLPKFTFSVTHYVVGEVNLLFKGHKRTNSDIIFA